MNTITDKLLVYSKTAAQTIFLALIVYFLTKRVYQDWTQVSEYSFDLDYGLLVISWLTLCLSLFLMVYCWNSILARLSNPLKFKNSLSIWAKSQLLKYTPGMVWGVVGRIYLSKREGFSTAAISLSLVLEAIFTVVSALIISFLAFKGSIALWWSSPWALALVIALFVLVTYPPWFNRVSHLAGRATKGGAILTPLQYRDTIILVLLYIGAWLLVGLGFSLLVASLYDVPVAWWPQLTGSFTAAWVAGFLVFIAPGGLGAREAVLVILLERMMPSSVALVVALWGRLWWISGEVGLFLLAADVTRLRTIKLSRQRK